MDEGARIGLEALKRATPEQIRHIFPNASQSTIAANLDVDGSPQGAESKCDIGNGALGAKAAKGKDSGRYIVRVVSYRVRLLDEDNLVPKWHIDSLRYAGILPSDAPDKTHIVTTQKKVAAKNQEKTLITIEFPD